MFFKHPEHKSMKNLSRKFDRNYVSYKSMEKNFSDFYDKFYVLTARNILSICNPDVGFKIIL
ncbi:MAG: hypothetical protein ACI9SY_000049 [Candidatus Paceibacteria bacterium]|jgi:hypothetical protein